MKEDLKILLNFAEKNEEKYCIHQCTSDCRRKGCNCECGEFHEDVQRSIKNLRDYLATYEN